MVLCRVHGESFPSLRLVLVVVFGVPWASPQLLRAVRTEPPGGVMPLSCVLLGAA